MAYLIHRRHATSSMATTTQILNLMQQLYSPNILILLGRVLAQVQIVSAPHIHPNRSLFSMAMMLTMMHIAAGFLHWLDMTGSGSSKGLILDYVGQMHKASLTRILLMDILIWFLQLLALTISYINHLSHRLPKTTDLPYEDLLFPIEPEKDEDELEAEDFDVERGLLQSTLSKEGDSEAPDEPLWLNERASDAPNSSRRRRFSRNRLLSNPPSQQTRIREPPLVLSISLSHLRNLILHLPAPTPPPPAFAGGTPAATPIATPSAERPEPLFEAEAEGDWTDEDDSEGTVTPRSGAQSPSGARNARRALGGSSVGRIPGDYWVARNNLDEG